MSLGIAALGAAAFRSGITPLHGARGWLCTLLVQSSDPHGWLSDLTSCRRQHTLTERQPFSVVQAAILQELHSINAFLAADSHLDGRRRSSLVLSAQSLPAPLPPHQVEPELPSLEAHVRDPEHGMARCAVKWLRRSGRVPGQVHSLMGSPGPGGRGVWELNVHFDETSLARMCHFPRTVPSLRGHGSDIANTQHPRLEGIEMIYCPVDRVVLVDVPVRLVNDEMAPGVRKGGWMCMLKRTVRYKALGNAIPPYIEVNVRHLDLEQDLLVRDLPIPPGTKIYEKNFNAPVVRCTMDVGKD
ncbi:hypothetical protein VOLCADRAFT_106036 [Volvox carteri f. nagariensis]|uniref:Large ribosomal subunit protein bL25 beta domain-containing protein n=1 Tax=Volvox carteri f. nagariensis TaxID=3068 RepID=D8U4P4_VOLCA|nr:uncharacterized protein VOLCADRAFT_106036 [Volvox carteri f. nagariensis]EFJ45223.1 hypothetical protein VOLCADRAFT_106036 [Volvox carteri f. nagariensis]|eukprot:XP_002953599.1 hypothetical protein VOLCADRAFT_106036 [Volvox carteri f. nagariensis]